MAGTPATPTCCAKRSTGGPVKTRLPDGARGPATSASPADAQAPAGPGGGLRISGVAQAGPTLPAGVSGPRPAEYQAEDAPCVASIARRPAGCAHRHETSQAARLSGSGSQCRQHLLECQPRWKPQRPLTDLSASTGRTWRPCALTTPSSG